MRCPASEILEIICLVEGLLLPTKRMLEKLCIPRTTFYRWYDRYLSGGPETASRYLLSPQSENRLTSNRGFFMGACMNCLPL